MQKPAIWLSEENVASLVSLNDTIEELENGMRALGQGKAFNIPKALGSLNKTSSMHSLGSALTEAGFCGYKNWINTPRGAKALFILFDAHEGRLLALMEANTLGQLRTSAMTGLGTKWLAPKQASDMAIIGTGRQALAQVAAVNAVRPLTRLRVWSPTPEKRRAFCDAVRTQFSMEIVEATTLESATEGAEIVTTVTRATQPFLHSALLARNAHLNAVGAILPSNAELHQDVFERVGMIAVDDVSNVRKASREFMEYFDQSGRDWAQVRPLGEIIANDDCTLADGDMTLFKSVGMGISDLSVAAIVYQRASAAALGRELPLIPSATIRWQ